MKCENDVRQTGRFLKVWMRKSTMYLQYCSHVLSLKVVILVSTKPERSEETSEGVCISVCANSVIHVTGEIFVVNHNTWKLLIVVSIQCNLQSVKLPSPRGFALIL